MGILGSTRLSEEGVNYVLFGAPAGADSAFTLSLVNTTNITAEATVSELGLASFTIDSPGTGYAVGDILTVPAGVGTGTAAQFKVKRIGVNGAVVDAEVHEAGAYTAIGSSPTYTVPAATGTGLVISSPLFAIKAITMVNTGNGYEAIPVVTTSWEAGAVLKAMLAVKAVEAYIIEPAIDLPAYSVYERSGLIISNGEAIAVSVNTQDAVNAAAWGFTS